jgi:branched-chain amino acid transport system permease protein
MTNAPALRIRGLTVQFGATKALDAVDIEVPEGTVAAVIGPNGAGKTTLIDAASGFISHARGEVAVRGETLQGLPPHRRVRAGLRRTFERCRAPGDLTAERYVRYAARNKLTDEDIQNFLALAGVDRGSVSLAELDVPARRLVELAGAAAAKPAVLMLDEPAAGLREAEADQLARRLLQLPDKYGISVLVVGQDMELVRSICSSVTVLEFGVRLASGQTAEVLNDLRARKACLGTEASARHPVAALPADRFAEQPRAG